MNATGLDPSEATATATRYIVSYLDEDSPNYHLYAVAVEARGRGLWAIHRHRQCLGADGTWGPDTLPDEGEDEWLREHRFPLEEALARARVAAARIIVNGISAAEAKAKADQRRKRAGQAPIGEHPGQETETDPFACAMELAVNAFTVSQIRLEPGPALGDIELAQEMALFLDLRRDETMRIIPAQSWPVVAQETGRWYRAGWRVSRDLISQWPPGHEHGSYLREVYDALVMLECRPDNIRSIAQLAEEPGQEASYFADFIWDAGNSALDAGHWPTGMEVNWHCGLAHAWVSGVGSDEPTLVIAPGATDPQVVAQRLQALAQVGRSAARELPPPTLEPEGQK